MNKVTLETVGAIAERIYDYHYYMALRATGHVVYSDEGGDEIVKLSLTDEELKFCQAEYACSISNAVDFTSEYSEELHELALIEAYLAGVAIKGWSLVIGEQGC